MSILFFSLFFFSLFFFVFFFNKKHLLSLSLSSFSPLFLKSLFFFNYTNTLVDASTISDFTSFPLSNIKNSLWSNTDKSSNGITSNNAKCNAANYIYIERENERMREEGYIYIYNDYIGRYELNCT